MSSRVKVNEKYGVLEMTLEKRKNFEWETICSTSNHNVIYEYFKIIKDNIKEVISYDNTTNITLNNSIGLQIPNNINSKNLRVFEPLHEGITDFNQAKKKSLKRTELRITIFAIALFSAVTGYKIKREISSTFTRSMNIMESIKDLEVEDTVDKIENNVVYPSMMLNNKEENIRLLNYFTAKNLGEVNYHEYLPSFGTSSYDSKYLSVVENYGHITKKYAEISGIDVEILNCILAQERGVHSDVIDTGGAIGVAQIQVNQHLGSTLTLYNQLTGEEEKFVVNPELLESVDGNVKTCVALFQRALTKFNGNLFLGLQAYNYGEGAMETVIRRSGYTIDEINQNSRDLSWMEFVYKYSDDKGGYGEKKYIDEVLSRYPNEELTVIYGDDPVTLNIKELQKAKRISF